jgi:hypothetical protein
MLILLILSFSAGAIWIPLADRPTTTTRTAAQLATLVAIILQSISFGLASDNGIPALCDFTLSLFILIRVCLAPIWIAQSKAYHVVYGLTVALIMGGISALTMPENTERILFASALLFYAIELHVIMTDLAVTL